MKTMKLLKTVNKNWQNVKNDVACCLLKERLQIEKKLSSQKETIKMKNENIFWKIKRFISLFK